VAALRRQTGDTSTPAGRRPVPRDRLRLDHRDQRHPRPGADRCFGPRELQLRALPERSVREQAEQTLAEHSALANDLARTGGPFPDRLHVNELVFKFMWEQTETVIRWATWAEHQVARWPEDIGHPPGPDVGVVLRKAAGAGS
jgi:hypothetical protein